jgi:hypothetical protein
MRRTGDSSPERDAGSEPLAPAVGFLVGLGLSVPLWAVIAVLIWLARPHVSPIVGAVVAWAVALAHIS